MDSKAAEETVTCLFSRAIDLISESITAKDLRLANDSNAPFLFLYFAPILNLYSLI